MRDHRTSSLVALLLQRGDNELVPPMTAAVEPVVSLVTLPFVACTCRVPPEPTRGTRAVGMSHGHRSAVPAQRRIA
jgi:hypothetical protein